MKNLKLTLLLIILTTILSVFMTGFLNATHQEMFEDIHNSCFDTNPDLYRDCVDSKLTYKILGTTLSKDGSVFKVQYLGD